LRRPHDSKRLVQSLPELLQCPDLIPDPLPLQGTVRQERLLRAPLRALCVRRRNAALDGIVGQLVCVGRRGGWRLTLSVRDLIHVVWIQEREDGQHRE
jgi:hypothetical protein